MANLDILHSAFTKELSWAQGNNYLLPSDLCDRFKTIADAVKDFPFVNSCIEISSDGDLKFSLAFDNGKQLNITKIGNTYDGHDQHDKVLYSLFINKVLIYSDVTDLEFSEGFKKYISE